MRTKVKICCIKIVGEVQMAIACGASALGLVSAMPSGPGVIGEALIAEIAAAVPPPIATFLLTSEVQAGSIVAQQRRCGTNTLQLCDHLPASVYQQIRDELPGIKLVQVVQVEDSESVDYAISAAQHVDAIQIPLFLAGGLTRSNVAEAIETVEPFGVDLCSSVRTDDNLDVQKLKDFFDAMPS